MRARSHHSGQPSCQRCHDSRFLCQTGAFDLSVCSLKSHNRAGSPGLLRCSNRSPLLQKAPLDRWLMGAGVEAQVLSETPAEVEGDDLRGWIQVQHFILRGCPLGPGAAPPDWPQSRTLQGPSERSDWTTPAPVCTDFTRSTRRVTSFSSSTQLLMMSIKWTTG